ncbi:MaoC/PaaZ C-terminal domain-containing protein [Mobilicoccus massiliensis]|uniref:MaoC/PaaZ C-terminal domain-containing protein n=1 Tax=Mobilicoccus massiliensis TaxID=1522310 RepID=UPI0005916347|nr:MaoC/PaaZ C-terminal domain-containing protein [Mobilicoccus massiliensis]
MSDNVVRPSVGAVAVGDEIEPMSVHVDRARLVEYAAASGDRNPIHWDERFATSVGLPDVIAHGMFTMGAAGELVSRWAGGAQYVRSYSSRFSKPVVVPHEGGADIEVAGHVKQVDEEAGEAVVELTVTHGGAKVLTKALATVALARA